MRIFLLPLLVCLCRLRSISSSIVPAMTHSLEGESSLSKPVNVMRKTFVRTSSREEDDTNAPKVVVIPVRARRDQQNAIHQEVFLTQAAIDREGKWIEKRKAPEFPRGHISKQEMEQYGPKASTGTIQEEQVVSSEVPGREALPWLTDLKIPEDEIVEDTDLSSRPLTKVKSTVGMWASPRDHFDTSTFQDRASLKPLFSEANEIFRKDPGLVKILNQPVSYENEQALAQLVTRHFQNKPELLAAAMAVKRETLEEMGGRGIIRDIEPFKAIAKGKPKKLDDHVIQDKDRELLGFIVDVPHDQELITTEETQKRDGQWVPVAAVAEKLERPEMLEIWNGMKHHITGDRPLGESQHIDTGSLPVS